MDLIEILKDVPQGTKLQCPLFKDPVTLHAVTPSEPYPIIVKTSVGGLTFFNKEGYYSSSTAPQNCMLYPPMMNSWDNVEYIPDGKLVVCERNGKIIQIGCAKGGFAWSQINVYWWYDLEAHKLDVDSPFYFDRQETEYECTNIYNLLRKEGYKMVGTELKPVSKFKKGDIVISEGGCIAIVDHVGKYGSFNDVIYYQCCINSCDDFIVRIDMGIGRASDCKYASTYDQERILRKLKEHGFEIKGDTVVKRSKFDFDSLTEFDKVLVRDSDESTWSVNIFSHYDKRRLHYRYRCVGDNYVCCIPYNDDTKHLVGTTMPAPEYYQE